MDKTKYKILIWAVILLMIINVAILATIWFTHHKQPGNRGTPADYLIKELGLNTKQQTRLKALAKEHHEQSEIIRGQIKDARHDLFKLLQQPNVSDSAKRSAAAIVAKNLEQLDLLTFDHFQQVRAICNPGQQKKFDEIIEDVLQMIAAGPPPGRGPRNREHTPPSDDRMPPPEH